MKNTQAYNIPTLEESRLFDEAMDIAERLRQSNFDDEATLLEEELLNPNNRHIKAIIRKFEKLFDNITTDIDILEEHVNTIINDDRANALTSDIDAKKDLANRIENICELQTPTKFKDILKYDDVYIFRDNVLDRRTISATQRYGMSNIPKDTFHNQKAIPNRYKKQIANRFPNGERIYRQPIVRYFTPSERLKLRNDQQTTIEVDDILSYTKNKSLPAPTKDQILTKSELATERHNDEWRVNFYKNAYAYDNYYRRMDAYEAYGREL